jgi:ubiquinone/menaquinone biosynthesis C-methylase UbiE
MLEDSSEELENARKEWDELSKRYDGYFSTFEGKLDRYLRWRVITECLPEDRAARILDAGGGTGKARIIRKGRNQRGRHCRSPIS